MKEKLRQFLLKRLEIPGSAALEKARDRFTPTEKAVFMLCLLLLLGSTMGVLSKINALFLVEVPAHGGELTEGIIGNPRFVNPLLALSDADRDLTALIYSGLMKPLSDGTLTPDLAEHYDVSEDGMTYTFYLREDATFHDGTPVNADDVIFTVQRAQDPALKSPRRANWEGVVAEKINEKTVRLTLKQPYTPFLENTTLGILPKHLWETTDAEKFLFSPQNIKAVGTGPYKVARITTNSQSGTASSFELTAFPKYALGRPYLARLFIRFYQNEGALLAAKERGEIESMDGVTPEAAVKLAEGGMRLKRTPLPRVFSVFFNQNQAPLLAEKEVRLALTLATDKTELVNVVLKGFGVPVNAPVPPLLLSDAASEIETSHEEMLAEANALLEKAKWKMNKETGIREKAKGKEIIPLSFSLATSEVTELKKSAEMLQTMWRRVGAEIKIDIYESGDLNQNVIRPRKFDALLFGEIVGRDLDLFAFWHSSQRNDPGLNVASYTNAKVDKWLEEARRTTDEEKRTESYENAVAAIRADAPAVFLYSPEFMYLLPEKIKGFAEAQVAIPSERFLEIHRWYVETEKVWSIFTN